MNEDLLKPVDGNGAGFERLYAILARLRAPDGCPWDREQTFETLKPCLIEECYELLDVMAGDDKAGHAEELGDVLLQVLFQCHMREENGDFSLSDVMNALADKLIRRHPHVFGNVEVSGTDDVLRNWEQIKKREKKSANGGPRSAIAGVPDALPSLLRAQRVQGKASRVGFDWDDAHGPRDKIAEELKELDEVVEKCDSKAVEDEIGDVLFSIVNLCRFLKVDAETALRNATDKFADRFRYVEKRTREEGRDMRDCSLAELDKFWDDAKRRNTAEK